MTVLPLHSNRSQLSRASRSDPLVVGLVNNMPDKALRSTERQFGELLAAAAGDRAIDLRVFSFPGLSRSDGGRQHVRKHHEDIAALWDAELDGLIVTGTEPCAVNLADEPYWPTLTALVEWAERNTISTVWSCLAAHAAVHYLDGIERHPLGGKLSGVFECAKAADHPLLAHGLDRWQTPHSRHNELREADLLSHGYQILARSAEAGADMFVKRRKSLFLFLQGHPEYDEGALLREYRRDVGRFLAGEVEQYPEIPRLYLDSGATGALLAFRERARRERGAALLSQFPPIAAVPQGWREAAVRLYANWLSHLADEKSRAGALAANRRVPAELKAAAAYG
jgi:homoserine O-succinyltransferase